MNYDRRRVGLEAKIQLLSEALEKQKKTRDGKCMVQWLSVVSSCTRTLFCGCLISEHKTSHSY